MNDDSAVMETSTLSATERPLSSLVKGEIQGEQAGYFAALVAHRVPVVEASLLRVDVEMLEPLRRAAERHSTQFERVRLRPLFPTASAMSALKASAPSDDAIDARIEGIAEVARSLGIASVTVAIAGTDGSPAGSAASVSRRGDPEEVHVWSEVDAEAFWRIDRRSTRVSEPGGVLSVLEAEAVADLVDRVQLVLGIPVEIDWCVQGGGRPVVLGVRPLELSPSFIAGRWSRLALVAADEGTVAPLAIDALDRGLQVGERAPSVESTVRRIYARPYRRHHREPTQLGASEAQSLARAGTVVARVVTEAAPVIADGLRFERTLDATFARLDVPNLSSLSPEGLRDAVRHRHRLVAEALLLLDRSRDITRRGLEALEALVGALPRDCYPALAAPRAVRKRRRIDDRLEKLRQRIEQDLAPERHVPETHGVSSGQHGSSIDLDRLSPSNRKRWNETREALVDVRPLGIDVVPLPIGYSDATLLRALERLPNFGHTAREAARREAAGRVVTTARSRSRGRLRAGLAMSITPMLRRVARTKGGVGEGVAASLLRLRRAACEVGRRLVERAVLDEPDDALYLSLIELEEALSREPGAYAARVRFRREDDERWRHYDAPRRIRGG